jgi:hypothetical protein
MSWPNLCHSAAAFLAKVAEYYGGNASSVVPEEDTVLGESAK